MVSTKTNQTVPFHDLSVEVRSTASPVNTAVFDANRLGRGSVSDGESVPKVEGFDEQPLKP
jgi:hypothetical protein